MKVYMNGRFFVHQNLSKIKMILWMFFNFFCFGFFSGSRETVPIGRSFYRRPSYCRPSHGVHCRIASNKVIFFGIFYTFWALFGIYFCLVLQPMDFSAGLQASNKVLIFAENAKMICMSDNQLIM